MKRVYVESPFRGKAYGETEKNVKYLHQCLRECVLRGENPFASHAYYTLFLDDKSPEERNLGIACGLDFARVCQETIVYVDRGISSGMRFGIEAAIKARRPIFFRKLGRGRGPRSRGLGRLGVG